MNEPVIVCPSCKTEIKLTESLAAPLIESTRRACEQKMTQKEAGVAKREATIKQQQDVLAKAQDTVNRFRATSSIYPAGHICSHRH